MSEKAQEDQSPEGVTIPVHWNVSETIHNQYIHNVIVLPGQNEITISFFETHVPPYVGAPEASKEYLQNQFVRFECVGKFVVTPQFVPEIIKALQVGLDSYNTSKAHEERETKR